jgi:hypothetical protein
MVLRAGRAVVGVYLILEHGAVQRMRHPPATIR